MNYKLSMQTKYAKAKTKSYSTPTRLAKTKCYSAWLISDNDVLLLQKMYRNLRVRSEIWFRLRAQRPWAPSSASRLHLQKATHC